jgi:hypothetical protein
MMSNQMDDDKNGKYLLLSEEAMEQAGGADTVVRVYKECNPKIKEVPPHDFSKHNMYMLRFGNCPLCFAGSKVIVKTEEEVEP